MTTKIKHKVGEDVYTLEGYFQVKEVDVNNPHLHPFKEYRCDYMYRLSDNRWVPELCLYPNRKEYLKTKIKSLQDSIDLDTEKIKAIQKEIEELK